MKSSTVIDLDGCDFSTQSPAHAVLADKRGLSASLPEVLGAVAVSIAILAAAGFGIGAAINFGQDSSAKGVLESVKSAQVLHQSKNGVFGDLTQLTTGDAPALTEKPTNIAINVTPSDKRNYCAVIESASMAHTKYYITGKTGEVKELPASGTVPAAELATGLTCPTPPSS